MGALNTTKYKEHVSVYLFHGNGACISISQWFNPQFHTGTSSIASKWQHYRGNWESSKDGGQDPRYLDAYKRLQEKALSVVDQLEAGLDAAGKTLPDSGLGLTHQRHKSILSLLSRFY